MNQFTEFFERLGVLIDSGVRSRQIEKQRRAGKNLAAITVIYQDGKSPWRGLMPEHPGLKKHLAVCREKIEAFKPKPGQTYTASFTDSYAAFGEKQLQSIDLNLGLPGATASDMAKIAKFCKPLLDKRGIRIKYVVVGTLVGNALLAFQHVEDIKAEAREAFDVINAFFPDAKMIVYDCPPVYNVYAATMRPFISDFLYRLVVREYGDGGSACFVSLQKYAGLLELFPKMSYTSDGVHASAKAFLDLDRRFDEAKWTRKSIV